MLTYLITPTGSCALIIERGPYIQSTTKNSAVIRWRTDGTNGTNPNIKSVVKYGTTTSTPNIAENTSHLLIYGEKKVGPANYTTSKNNISKRKRTANVVVWEPALWTSASATRQTPSLVTIVQQLVKQSNWAADKDDMAFLIYGSSERTAVSFDGAAANAPLLYIEYGGGTVNKQVTASNHDAEEFLLTGAVNIISTDLELGADAMDSGTFSQVVGLKFTNTGIPENATITKAYIEFTVDGDDIDPTFKDHEVTITGLLKNKKYFYRIMDGTGTNNTNDTLVGGDSDHYFWTHHATSAGGKTIWVLGDSGNGGLGGSNGNRARKVRDAFEDDNGGPHADLMLMLGDNAYPDGKDEEYQDALFENMYEETLRNSALFPVVGNHEIDGTTITNSIYQTGTYYNIFTLPRAGEGGGRRSGTEAYYSFDYGNIHFVCLESITPIDSSSFANAMEGWLDADLGATSKEWIIALWHHPPYSFGTHNTDDSDPPPTPPIELESQYMREDPGILKTLEDNGVDLVLVDHSHCYERTMLINGHYSESDDYDDSTGSSPL